MSLLACYEYYEWNQRIVQRQGHDVKFNSISREEKKGNEVKHRENTSIPEKENLKPGKLKNVHGENEGKKGEKKDKAVVGK